MYFFFFRVSLPSNLFYSKHPLDILQLMDRENAMETERRAFEARIQQAMERASRGERCELEAARLRRQLEVKAREWVEDATQCRRLKEALEELKARYGLTNESNALDHVSISVCVCVCVPFFAQAVYCIKFL